MNNLTHCPHCGKRLDEPKNKKPDYSKWPIEAQIMAGVPKIYIPHSAEIQNALREHFKLTPKWSSNFERQWLEWAVGIDMTADQIKKAAEVWHEDKRFNWQAANLKGIYDHLQELLEPRKVEGMPTIPTITIATGRE